MVIMPAACILSMIKEFSFGTKSLNNGDANVVFIPLVRKRSLWVTGKPCNGPMGFPEANKLSASSASLRPFSCSNVTIAFTLGFTFPICCNCISINSRHDIFLLFISSTIFTAGKKHISVSVILNPYFKINHNYQ